MVKKFKIHTKAFISPDSDRGNLMRISYAPKSIAFRRKQDIPMSHKTRVNHFLKLSYKACKWALLLAAFFLLFALSYAIYYWLRFRG